MNQYLKTLRLDPQFKDVVSQLKSMRPHIVKYNATTDNVREVVQSMMRAEGFDLCITLLESK